MSDTPESEDKEDDRASTTFFSILLGVNIVLFVLIALLEYRAFRIAGLADQNTGLEVGINEPESKDDQDPVLYGATTRLARKMYSAGQAAFHKCKMCHALDATVPNYGPHLVCVPGRNIANSDDNTPYRFSVAITKKARELGVWSLPHLHDFIARPNEFVPGTRMPFPGLLHDGIGTTDAARRKLLRDVVQFLYWNCDKQINFEEVRMVTLDADGRCDDAPPTLAELSGIEMDPDRYLLSRTPECHP